MTDTANLEPRRLRDIFGSFATGLTVITATTPGGPAGFTCQSFAALSLEPALVSFSPARTSSTWPVLRDAGSFTINILPAEHQHLAGQFARSGADKFAGVDHTPSPLGHPVLADALAWIDCEIQAEHDGGDHTIVVAAVRHLALESDGDPLLFFRGRYGELSQVERLLQVAG